MSGYPQTRMRRLRRTGSIRDLVQENNVSVNDLIIPIFVEENLDERTPITSLPGIYRETERSLKQAVKEAWKFGIKTAILFGVSHSKDSSGSDSLHKDGLLSRMIRVAKDACPDMVIIADACFCEYTDHGHCGVLDNAGDIDNDCTLESLDQQAIIAANSGADIIAPSGMIDGMVGSIRSALDSNGHKNVAILSYAAKFASAFYGPFKDAAGSSLGVFKESARDRKTCQINPANAREALREVAIDIQEGADMVMIKPGLPYLDIIHSVSNKFNIPVFAYHVSGEYAMLKAASENGWIDYDQALYESFISFKRAGCSGIFTYGALDFAKTIDK